MSEPAPQSNENPLSAVTTSAAPRPRLSQVLLGAFIVWQLFFLLALNYTQLLVGPAGTNPVAPDSVADHAAVAVRDFTARWAQLTGENQSWWLFAYVRPESVFPLVELRCQGQSGAPYVLRGLFDPADPSWYFHPPGSSDRLFHYEMNVMLAYDPWNEKRLAEEPVVYQKEYLARARDKWKPVLAYLQWRVQLYQQQHPEIPPVTEVVLLQRTYATVGPDEQPFRRPLGVNKPLFRWRPGSPPPADCAPLDVYDPVEKRFVPLLLKDAS